MNFLLATKVKVERFCEMILSMLRESKDLEDCFGASKAIRHEKHMHVMQIDSVHD
jgi:hypothetical protein